MSDIEIPSSLPPFIKEHLKLYLADGEAGHLWDSTQAGGDGIITTLLLTTIGRKSGKTLTLPLIYGAAGDNAYCIIASKGGSHNHPAWFLNLREKPEAKIKVANDEFDVTWRIAEGEERENLWQQMAAAYSPYHDYQARTERQIPVVVLERK